MAAPRKGATTLWTTLTSLFKEDANIIFAYGTDAINKKASDVKAHAFAYWGVLWHTRIIKSIALFLMGWVVLWVSLCASNVIPGEETATFRLAETCTTVIDGKTICSENDVQTKERVTDGWAMTIGVGIPLFFFYGLWLYILLSRVQRWAQNTVTLSAILEDIFIVIHNGLFLVSFTMFLPRWSGSATYPWYAVGSFSTAALWGYALQTIVTPLPHSRIAAPDTTTNP